MDEKKTTSQGFALKENKLTLKSWLDTLLKALSKKV
jgi:hypothetical protein